MLLSSIDMVIGLVNCWEVECLFVVDWVRSGIE